MSEPMKTEINLIKLLSKERTNLQKILKSIRIVEKLIKNEPSSNLLKIKRELSKVEKLLGQSKLDHFLKKSIKRYIETIRSKIPEWEENVKRAFGQKLGNALKQAGFELRGHYPLLKVLFYTLEVNFDDNNVTIWYGSQQERLDKCKLDPEEVAKKLKDIHNKITQRRFDDKTFLSNLFDAYKVAIYRHGKNMGDQVRIADILSEYAFLVQDKKFKVNPTKRNYKEYGRVFFSYDLYRLKERKIGNYEMSLVIATRAYTRRKSDFLWVPSNEKGDGTYISHLKFREVSS